MLVLACLSAAAFSPALQPAPRLAASASRPRLASAAPVRAALPDLAVAVYDLQLVADVAVTRELQHLTPASALILFGAGLLASLTPCAISMVPLTLGYIGGLGDARDEDAEDRSTLLPAVAFSSGLACTLAAFGVAASLLGGLYGSQTSALGVGVAFSLITAAVAVGMGLNLLEVLPFSLPSLRLDVDGLALPRTAQAFLFGASSGLISSPCSSPILVSILTFVAALGDPLLGGALLLFYTAGYTMPVLLAGVFMSRINELQERFLWVAPASGCMLLSYGTYTGCCALLGSP